MLPDVVLRDITGQMGPWVGMDVVSQDGIEGAVGRG